MTIFITLDTEKDLHSERYKGLFEGIPLILKILDKKTIKCTFFVPAKLLEKFPDFFIELKKQGHEIALHGYEHERFDDLDFNEVEIRINKSIKIYKNIFKCSPKGFRAPQHSIDNKTLKILQKNNFLYDSSNTPLNLLQLLFFPKKFKQGLKTFFKPTKIHKLRKDFYEIPVSSFFIPFVSLPLRIFPWPILKMYLRLLMSTNKNLVFYAHSWDFIKLINSKIDRTFSYKRLLKNLEMTINYLFEKNKFSTIGKEINGL